MTRLTYASRRPPAAVIAGVTSVQDDPSFRVSCRLPSLVPAQITPRVSGDSEIEVIANHGMPPGRPPSDSGRIRLLSLVLRSGLISVHVLPRSGERRRNCAPA